MTKVIVVASIMGFILIYSVIMALKPKNESVEDKVKRLVAEKEDTPVKAKKAASWKEYLTSLSKYTPRKWGKQLDKDLYSGDIGLTGREFIVMQIFLFILAFLIALILLPLSAVFIILPLLSLIFPRLYISSAKNKKIKKFNNQLPDILLTLANSLKAGFSLFQAMEMAAQEMPDPLSSEIKMTLKEMAYGESTENALLNLSQRVESKDLELMVTAILIQRQIGGNLAEILINIHDTIQERLQIQGEIKTLTAQGRLSGYIIGALPILIGLVITMMQPSFMMPLFQDPLGIVLLCCGAVLEIIGFIAIRKIVNIKF
ncbi:MULTISPECIES: type II secretion system F family protein [unclassified Dehalobacter]|uniref:type II secretion system F family protein n=1 Tax=unclassified Dehalobacter TaxID=2635733 RepID=UPI00036F7A0E|nr:MULTISPECIES: type II secretion system F family protein [unclassified Dehalobacter]RJE48276.1 type II secretion protein F [Dehalobacter sp. MCB1]TCX50343.1 type II secretion protein F [Dehalobacter sp. 14DCB1]TCX52417.1 type II secretion protein F [Dehalobacter sp. 12DCB1]